MSLSDYLNSVGRVPLLTPQEEIILGTQVQKMVRILADKEESELTDQEKRTVKIGRKAKNRMVSANLRLVVNVAKKFRPQNHMKMEDLLQEGTLGLMRAVEKFDPERGYKFSTYAYWWIRQGITRAGENQEHEIRVPAHLQRMAKQAAEAKARFSGKYGREPSMQEIANAIGEPDGAKVEYAISHQAVTFSLDISTVDNDKSPLIEIIKCDNEAELEENANIQARIDLLMLAVNTMDAEEGQLIKKRYGIGCDPVPVKQLAAEYKMSVQGVRDKIARGMNKIRMVITQFG
jgi:RNA polymerase primary sigma factor